jgi:hypothetical protein
MRRSWSGPLYRRFNQYSAHTDTNMNDVDSQTLFLNLELYYTLCPSANVQMHSRIPVVVQCQFLRNQNGGMLGVTMIPILT